MVQSFDTLAKMIEDPTAEGEQLDRPAEGRQGGGVTHS